MVSSFSIVMMALCAFLGVAVPIALAWWLVKKHHARLGTILVGAGVFSRPHAMAEAQQTMKTLCAVR